MRSVSVLNHKGGVGKTTFTGCIAQALSLIGFRVLVIDNDSQHNLSTMLGCGICNPNIRDVYLDLFGNAPKVFLQSIRKTELDNLHIVPSCSELCADDVKDIFALKNILSSCGLERFYDFLLIDNAPGLDKLQISSVYACCEIFVPIELKQFAVDGIVEMEKKLASEHPNGAKITKIIPNFYKNTIRQNSFLLALQKLFPEKVVQTPIPYDSVFDELITENKILFLHRLASRAAAYYIKLVHELFEKSEEDLWNTIKKKRDERRSEEAKERFFNKNKY